MGSKPNDQAQQPRPPSYGQEKQIMSRRLLERLDTNKGSIKKKQASYRTP
jgi:hypothetical protein